MLIICPTLATDVFCVPVCESCICHQSMLLFPSSRTVSFEATHTTHLLKLVRAPKCSYVCSRLLLPLIAYEVRMRLLSRPTTPRLTVLKSRQLLSAPFCQWCVMSTQCINHPPSSLLLVEYVASTAYDRAAESAMARKGRRTLPIPVCDHRNSITPRLY